MRFRLQSCCNFVGRLCQTPTRSNRGFYPASDTDALQERVKQSGSGFFIPEPLRKLTRVIMALAAESPRPFSFHAPVCPALAQPQLAVRLLADRQVDHKRLAFALVRPALGPELH